MGHYQCSVQIHPTCCKFPLFPLLQATWASGNPLWLPCATLFHVGNNHLSSEIINQTQTRVYIGDNY